MNAFPDPNTGRERTLGAAVLLAATAVALASALPYAGSWNDGSRLAAVESLAERGTMRIDDSAFVRPEGTPAYDPAMPALAATGTLDKMCIDGHFYSDKSPVPTLLLTPAAACLQALSGTTARVNPARFCYWLTLAWSGLAYVVAVWCAWRLGRPLGLGFGPRLLLAAALAFGTLALPYSRQVNNHLPLLAVASVLTLQVAALRPQVGRPVRTGGAGPLAFGFAAGLAYTIDLGVGPALCLGAGAWVGWRLGGRALAWFVLGALPWLALHHTLNWAVGGTLAPANANPEFFRWPGCPFLANSLTGSWRHESVGGLLAYAADLLAGRRGLLWHALPLVLALPGAVALAWSRRNDRPELLLMLGWFVGPWLVYAAGSNNLSGLCCSVRWFVPLVAPGWFCLAVLLRERPRLLADVALLAGWGMVISAAAWWRGPWDGRTGVTLWLALAGAGFSWAWLTVRRLRAARRPSEPEVVSCRVTLELSSGRFHAVPAAPLGPVQGVVGGLQ